MLDAGMREIKVLCEPANTPDSIDVDVSELTPEHALHVSDLKVGEGIEIHEARKRSLRRSSRQGSRTRTADRGGAEPEVVGEEPLLTPEGESG